MGHDGDASCSGMPSWPSLGRAAVRAQRGHRAQPTDRGKAGTKRHLVVDDKGRPPGLTTSGANRHDSRMSAPTLDAVLRIRGHPGRPRCRPHKLHADKAATIAGAAGSAAASLRASPGAVPTPLSALTDTAGKSSAAWLGLPSSVASPFDMNDVLMSTSPLTRSPAPSSASGKPGGFVPSFDTPPGPLDGSWTGLQSKQFPIGDAHGELAEFETCYPQLARRPHGYGPHISSARYRG